MKKRVLQIPRKCDKANLLYHSYRFGILGNLRVLLCRIVGHRICSDPKHHHCERCGLAYEEIYHKKGDYFILSGIVKVKERMYTIYGEKHEMTIKSKSFGDAQERFQNTYPEDKVIGVMGL